ncbi:DNA damage-inducible protein [Jeongeupia sp. HS-3]|uniref:DEAD/DEAH box helicase n=1 Tax=Jeongeupia sp. HS-3 TaxID=1009682 RepID=UPI0018A37EC0|nr:type ISP restriction/modification enzyme [Jeongeupia sp. HS-3]BCL75795.1 DNA damage-inducible protein [Jeongeupia sp. HS-3]
MSPLQTLLHTFRSAAVTEREKGTYFEELIVTYLRNEATYADLYAKVWMYADWAKEMGLDGNDTGIDLVAQTQGTGEYHAIQCKFYAEDYRVQKADIDSFFTASGKKPFAHRIIVTTTNNWGVHAEDALRDQQPPVSKIDLFDLENSQVDWAQYQPKTAPTLKPKKQLREHQQSALKAVENGLATAERGKLIMACGTGKTFTSLKIAEKLAGKGQRVLFLVPSLSLLSQTLTEWTQESDTPLHSFAVCSDSDVGKKRKKDDDEVQTFTHELRYPATTQADRLATEMAKRHDDEHISVVFSTYHSIDVLSRAQKEHGLADFDLIVCDEAHRTTGATFGDDDESAFVRVHDNSDIRGGKRLYMTATPRIYGENAKAKADSGDVALCSMDDESLYGKELFVINFSEAVQRELLVDYKVIVLTIDADHVIGKLGDLLGKANELKVDDAARIVGCWKALSKQDTADDLGGDAEPMRRAVAFCQVIAPSAKAKKHQVASTNIANLFADVVEAYKAETFDDDLPSVTLRCEAEHVDGGMNASQKEEKLSWLKDETPDNTCRILSNVRCLSEGVDVPALDAVLFLTPRNSQVDVVQSVGRVMRRAEGKKRGYVILPVVIPPGKEAHEALNDNDTYRVVWQVLQALRSHDDRFDAMINKLQFDSRDPSKMEVIAITDKVAKPSRKGGKTGDGNTADPRRKTGKGTHTLGETPEERQKRGEFSGDGNLQFEIGEIERAIYAKVVQKCGNRHHWEDWAKDIAKIAQTHIARINGILADSANVSERAAFNAFATELRDDLNDSISDAEIVEMLAQHLITKPVFDALFADYSFASNNPMSQAMQAVLDVLHEHHLAKEADTLERFYASVKTRAENIQSMDGKQKIVVELYDKFFRNAFPRMTERLGIVYTPVEVVDFIIESVNHLLHTEFGQTLGSDGVHIIDPFTGTGTFITRLMQLGLEKGYFTPEQLQRKYRGQIHANEIVLLAYYIAAINIEAVYHGLVGGEYRPFEGICLTDTFQMYEKDDLVDQLLVQNSARRKKQKALDIRVIIGNPPYSAGQDSANDDAANLDYPHLDQRISQTYITRSQGKGGKRSSYDSYIRAIRWASDRLGNSGIIGFVSGSGFVEKPAMDGMRKCLAEEFTNLYIFNLRGDIRKNMLSKGKAKEGQNIFGSASMTGIAISLLVKNPKAKQYGQIFYHNIGDNLSTADKLERISALTSIAGINTVNGWAPITPDQYGDWLSQRDDSLSQFLLIGTKKTSNETVLFQMLSNGVVSNRDAWVYCHSKEQLSKQCREMIAFYNCEVDRYKEYRGSNNEIVDVQDFVKKDTAQISWGGGNWQAKFAKGIKERFEESCISRSLYRPFAKIWHYGGSTFNHSFYSMPRVFPTPSDINFVICISGVGARSGFSVLITDTMPNLHTLDTGLCFPFYMYESADADQLAGGGTNPNGDLFAAKEGSQAHARYTRRDAITDEGLAHFAAAYPGESIGKEDVFYYVYGLLHSPDYRERYVDNLAKELPRIPRVKIFADFRAFSGAGRALAELHLNYETVAMYPADIIGDTGESGCYRVEKMKYAKNGKDKDLSTLIYNDQITVRGIPVAAYEYVVNGKPALDWVVDRQGVSTHKDSDIVNDANDWATETMGNPRYPLELFLRVITVSLETMKIVNALPKLDILTDQDASHQESGA